MPYKITLGPTVPTFEEHQALDQAVESAVTRLNRQIENEVKARETADRNEAEARSKADGDLKQALDTESTMREDADKKLRDDLDKQVREREKADSDEATAREQADAALKKALEAALGALGTESAKLTTAIGLERMTRQTADEVRQLEQARLLARVGEVDAGIKKLNDDLGALADVLNEVNLGTFQELNSIQEKIKESVNDRDEYRELWAAQKRESEAIELLAAEGGDPEIKALIAQKGLEVAISRRDLQKLAVDKANLRAALASYPANRAGDYSRLVTNLSYAYILMAQHYKVAREHVSAVVANESVYQSLASVGKAVLMAALAAGLSAVTAGVAGVLMPAVMNLVESIQSGVAKASGNLAAAATSSAMPSPTALDAYKKEQQLKKIGEAVGGAGAEFVFSLMGGPEGTLIDPYDFFLGREAELRKAAAMIAGTTDDDAIGGIRVQLDQPYTLDELAQSPTWGFLTRVHANFEEIDAIWARVSELLAVAMRRHCWRSYCRAQWKNKVFDFRVKLVDDREFLASHLRGKAEDWHYKIWNNSSMRAPNWDKICADFRGPEHDPTHVLTRKAAKTAEARELMGNFAWISMATVQCCQLMRFDSFVIDLERRSHIGGVEGDVQVDETQVYSDVQLASEGRGNVGGLETYLHRIRTDLGVRVAISEIRFGGASSGSALTGFGLFSNMSKSSGKKGTLAKSNSMKTALPILRGLNMTVMVSRRNAAGDVVGAGGESAYLEVYRARTDSSPAKKVQFHDDGNPCPVATEQYLQGQQLCWYCKNIPEGKRTESGFRSKPRLHLMERTPQGSRNWSEGYNYQNFPYSGTVSAGSYAHKPGLYCVRLDPRPELLTAAAGNAGTFQEHVSDEWWFRILDEYDSSLAPRDPKLIWMREEGTNRKNLLARGATSISGTFEWRTGDKRPVVIHVRINGHPYSSQAISRPDGEGEKEVSWSIDVPPLSSGSMVKAIAVWDDDDGGTSVQSPGRNDCIAWVVPMISGVKLMAGRNQTYMGQCDAMASMKIVMVKRERVQNPQNTRLWMIQFKVLGAIVLPERPEFSDWWSWQELHSGENVSDDMASVLFWVMRPEIEVGAYGKTYSEEDAVQIMPKRAYEWDTVRARGV